MALSNTAVPKYYGAFREAVIRGDIPVNEYVSLEMNRIDALIEDPDYFYDDNAVEGWIAFCENELVLTDGSDLKLLDSFKLWAEQVYGWYYFKEVDIYVPNPSGVGGHYERRVKKKRLTTKQYLIVARGAAKSLYDSCHQAFYLVVDNTATHQITTAPTMKQSEEVTSVIETALTRRRGPYIQFLTEGSLQNTTGDRANRPKLASTKIGIQNFFTNSKLEIKPLSINKLQGLRVKCATIDEWLSGDLREDPVAAIEQGAAKGGNDDYLIIATSSEGNVRNGAGDSMKMELIKILRGEFYAPHISIWYYCLDDISEVGRPEMWPKANPNIGITVSYEAVQRDVERAEQSPAVKNDILAKRFGIPLEGYTYFFTYDECKLHHHRDYWGLTCALGADMSQGDDFCAFTFLFPLPNGRFGIKVRSYISSLTYHRLKPAMRTKYDNFIKEGSLVVLDGAMIDMMEVYEDLDNFIIEHNYDVLALGYDPYNAKAFVERWCQENGEFGVEKVHQGARTESVPLGEIKKLTENRMLFFDEELFGFTMQNCISCEDTNGNRKLVKRRREEKIDNVAAAVDAMVAFKVNIDMFN